MKKLLLTLQLLMGVIAFSQNNTHTLKNHNLKKQGYFVQQNKNNRLLTNGNSVQQTQSVNLLDSIHFWSLDTTTQTWKLDGRLTAYTYDTQNRNTGYLNQNLNGSVWVNAYLVTFSYNNNTKTETDQTWDANNHVWVNSTRYTYVYDANNNLLSQLLQGWTNNAWANYVLDTYNYNSLNEMTYHLSQNWSNNTWCNESRGIIHYNTNGVQTYYSATTWDSNTHQIYDSLLNTNTINSNNDITCLINMSWNFTTNVFDTTSRYLYTYDNYHNQVSSLYQGPYSLVGGVQVHVWSSADSVACTYSTNNLVTKRDHYLLINNSWFKNNITLDSYDASGNNLGRSDRSRYGSTTWQGDSAYHYYSTVTGINKVVDNNNLITIYPNPSKGNVSIETNMQPHALKIYDIKGSLVLEKEVSNKENIDISFLEDGAYNMVLIDGTSSINKKLIIIK